MGSRGDGCGASARPGAYTSMAMRHPLASFSLGGLLAAAFVACGGRILDLGAHDAGGDAAVAARHDSGSPGQDAPLSDERPGETHDATVGDEMSGDDGRAYDSTVGDGMSGDDGRAYDAFSPDHGGDGPREGSVDGAIDSGLAGRDAGPPNPCDQICGCTKGRCSLVRDAGASAVSWGLGCEEGGACGIGCDTTGPCAPDASYCGTCNEGPVYAFDCRAGANCNLGCTDGPCNFACEPGTTGCAAACNVAGLGCNFTCGTGDTCDFGCTLGPCNFDCDAGSGCKGACTEGPCAMTCGAGDACNFTCTTGPCTVVCEPGTAGCTASCNAGLGSSFTCGAGDTCAFACTSGPCNFDCRTGSTCTASCTTGPCTMTCETGATCSYAYSCQDCVSNCLPGSMCKTQ